MRNSMYLAAIAGFLFATIHSPAAQDRWKYTTNKPGKGWDKPGGECQVEWKTGEGGFGKKGTPGGTIRTTWTTPDIWMLGEYVLKEDQDVTKLSLEVCHDEDFEVYLNGVLAAEAKGHIKDYRIYFITHKAQKTLKVGKNLVAVHCHQTTGGQFIDVAVTDKKKPTRVAATGNRKKPAPSPPLKVDYAKLATWQETMLDARARASASVKKVAPAVGAGYAMGFWKDFPVETDWLMQDGMSDMSEWKAVWSGNEELPGYLNPGRDAALEQKLIEKVLQEHQSGELEKELEKLVKSKVGPEDRQWLDLYIRACLERRRNRLMPLLAKTRQVVFAKHQNMGGGFFAYTEYTHWKGNIHGGLCRLDLDAEAVADGKFAGVTELIKTDAGGAAIRDPALSYDAKRVLFAWRKGDKERFYHVYEMELATGRTRLITGADTYGASYEACYLPDGNIMFNSSRVVQSVDCAGPDVSNLFICDRDGKFARQVGFDQVHTPCPVVLDDGRVVYMRWDYNDRSQIYTQALFQMNPDGTAQTEYFGNNTFEPTTFFHPRGIPGTTKVMCALGGHHNPQCGKLAIIDNTKGRQGIEGVTEIPSGKPPTYGRADRYAQQGDQFCYPFPLDEKSLLVSYDPLAYYRGRGNNKDAMRFHLYYMTVDGKREILSADHRISSMRPIPVIPRKTPNIRASVVDHLKKTGTYFMQDIYHGPGLKGIERGTIKKLRVVALRFREMNIGSNGTSGKGGGARVVTPIATGTGAWDVKVILGDATVYEDGSAMFEVPAKTPVYFQALNENNQVIQTMRTWSTLMPGETFSCVGCHENKNDAPKTAGKASQAMKAGAEQLKTFYGEPRGFSFPREVQPILDKHCIKCHSADGPEKAKDYLLTGDPIHDGASKRNWARSYMTLTKTPIKGTECNRARGQANDVVNWISNSSEPTMIPPQYGGSTKSSLLAMNDPDASPCPANISLSREELDKLAAWIDLAIPFCGDYVEANAWNEGEMKTARERLALNKKAKEIDSKNVEEYVADLGNREGR